MVLSPLFLSLSLSPSPPMTTLHFLVITSHFEVVRFLNARKRVIIRLNILLFKKDNQMHFCDCGEKSQGLKCLNAIVNKGARANLVVSESSIYISPLCCNLCTHNHYNNGVPTIYRRNMIVVPIILQHTIFTESVFFVPLVVCGKLANNNCLRTMLYVDVWLVRSVLNCSQICVYLKCFMPLILASWNKGLFAQHASHPTPFTVSKLRDYAMN